MDLGWSKGRDLEQLKMTQIHLDSAAKVITDSEAHRA